MSFKQDLRRDYRAAFRRYKRAKKCNDQETMTSAAKDLVKIADTLEAFSDDE